MKPKYVAFLGGMLLILGSFLPWVIPAEWPNLLYSISVTENYTKPFTLIIGVIIGIGALATQEAPGRNGSLPVAICGMLALGVLLEHFFLIPTASVGLGLFPALVGAILAIVGGYRHNPGEALERPAPLLSPGAWPAVWVKAVTQPVVATFEALVNDPNVTASRAYGWIFVASLISIAVQLVGKALVASPFDVCVNLPLPPQIPLCPSLPFVPIVPILSLIIIAGVTHGSARRLGGSGTYSQLTCAYAAFTAPLILIMAVIAVAGSPIFIPLHFGLLLYGFVLEVIALKAVHQLTWSRAILAATSFVILYGIAYIVILGIVLSRLNLRGFFFLP